MYEPVHFRIEDRDAIASVIRANPLGVLISTGEGGILANPVPFLFEQDAHGADVLRAHVARANPHWQALRQAPEVLVVFQGADHYISPDWYPSKREHGKVVPTWNYVHVQVRGTATIREDAAFLSQQIDALTRQHEAGRATPWGVEDAPPAYIEAQKRAIVGIEIAIRTLSGKFKLSQNRSEADQAGVRAGLEQAGQAELSALMIGRQRETRE